MYSISNGSKLTCNGVLRGFRLMKPNRAGIRHIAEPNFIDVVERQMSRHACYVFTNSRGSRAIGISYKPTCHAARYCAD